MSDEKNWRDKIRPVGWTPEDESDYIKKRLHDLETYSKNHAHVISLMRQELTDFNARLSDMREFLMWRAEKAQKEAHWAFFISVISLALSTMGVVGLLI